MLSCRSDRQVRDENDNAPRVSGLQKEHRSRELDARPECRPERTLCVSFLEAQEAPVGRVLATDADLSGSPNALLTYSLVSVTPISHRVRQLSPLTLPITRSIHYDIDDIRVHYLLSIINFFLEYS